MTDPGPPAQACRHLEAGGAYLLKSVGLLRTLFDGDLMRGLVFLAALRLSADEPVSLSALARALAMPIETTRRHVLKLQREGFVARTANGGVRVAGDLSARDDLRQALAANSRHVSEVLAATKPKRRAEG